MLFIRIISSNKIYIIFIATYNHMNIFAFKLYS